MAIRSGATQVQGTINGLGERCGNADLVAVIPNLQLKMGYDCFASEKLSGLKMVSRQINELANLGNFNHQPFVGDAAFAHKGGIHVSAVKKNPATYEHIPPESVGNERRFLVSDMSGGATILGKAKQFGLELKPKSALLRNIVTRVKDLEYQGYQYETAEASLEILMRSMINGYLMPFDVEELKLLSHQRKGEGSFNDVMIFVKVGDESENTSARSDGPVNAIDKVLRKFLVDHFSCIGSVELTDFRVRNLNGAGTDAKVRVHCDWTDGNKTWQTVGVSRDIIEASREAIVDSYAYKILIG